MPQLFEKLPELLLVDWATLALYTCSSHTCLPGPGEGYIEEFVYTQFSEDFARVQYSDGGS